MGDRIECALDERLTARGARPGLTTRIGHQLGELALIERREPADRMTEFSRRAQQTQPGHISC